MQGSQNPSDTKAFPRQLRLLKPAEFKRVFDESCRVGNQYLTLLSRKNELGHPRLGLAISKKHVKTAVGRNRIKRRIRENFRLHQQAIGSLDIVILSRVGIARIENAELHLTLEQQWQRLAKKCENSSSC
ncbi:MAG: ribonuclease P protein component [Gammaproteobacteria bacterium]|nr:ribonuclease P protein component [Gammaproteobacteria bacterium]